MIFVIIPIHNIQDLLPTLLAAIQVASVDWHDSYRALVVDDGSTDESANLVLDFASYGDFELLRHPTRQGEGAAVRTGLTTAMATAGTDDRIIVLRATDIHTTALIKQLLHSLDEGNDVALASRYSDGGERIGLSPSYDFVDKLLAHLMQWLFPVSNIHDHNSRCIAFCAGTLTRLADRCNGQIVTENGFAFQLEILLKLTRLDSIRIAEIPQIEHCDLEPGSANIGRLVRQQARIIRQSWRHKRAH